MNPTLSSMQPAEKLCVLSSGVFFMTALLTGIWKWRQMATSKAGTAHKYVDTAHRASLMYAFSALLVGKFSTLNDLSAETNLMAVQPPLFFFAGAIGSYLLHGFLEDTTNQIARPLLGTRKLPQWVTPMFMTALAAAEIGGFAVLLFGFIRAAY
uniref:Integral membrane protein n=1 Tax=Chromera velia CCMP2878 TaxID=1169474 RepID=A0A0G4F8A9_9ALVE|eukprot:Cvel_15522.t1-p1 / transcript=Cvel_15522.t1 / gene=Cvel_15522 / organism=Chromera_velia_CCMP2878 / gene_product=hypothetical protein / transcript_product=hypothetical protein / location=Cvel_scaffold1153:6491-6949(+) / protein_length=153 / sequence_SO=supercontig / SO=protein_coding / is_pseudo=false